MQRCDLWGHARHWKGWWGLTDSGVGGAGLRRTPLYPVYARHGGRTVEFGGWEMPVQFAGITAEHHAVRTAAGLFDVSHMGEIEVQGPGALDLVQKLATNDVGTLVDGQAQYALMCNDRGGVVDDLLVYRLAAHRYLLVVNAGNIGQDFAHIQGVAAGVTGVTVADRSPEYALLALQGPAAAGILGRVLDGGSPDVTALKPFHFEPAARVMGRACLVSRTGYTGEDGFEIYCRAADGIHLWEVLLSAGEGGGLMPCGLGARDTLRFEACLALYGNELTGDTNPLEAGLGFFVKLDKGEFIGRDALVAVKAAGPARRLVGLEMLERGIPRHDYPVTDGAGRVVGRVTSGTHSPTLDKSLAMAYVPAGLAAVGTELAVVIRGTGRRCRVVRKPFYKRTV